MSVNGLQYLEQLKHFVPGGRLLVKLVKKLVRNATRIMTDSKQIDYFASDSPPKPRSWGGLAAFAAVSAITGGLVAVSVPFILPAFRKVCLPYVPATTTQVKHVAQALGRASGRRAQNVAEIGSGDGRIAFEVAKQGYNVVGYELNPWLVYYCRLSCWRQGLRKRCTFHKQDLWKVNYSVFNNVVIFGVEEMMPALERKLLQEMQPGARIIACRFPLTGLKPNLVIGEGVDAVWAYRVPS